MLSSAVHLNLVLS